MEAFDTDQGIASFLGSLLQRTEINDRLETSVSVAVPAQKLDICIDYLRQVHHFDYYEGKQYLDHADLTVQSRSVYRRSLPACSADADAADDAVDAAAEGSKDTSQPQEENAMDSSDLAKTGDAQMSDADTSVVEDKVGKADREEQGDGAPNGKDGFAKLLDVKIEAG